MDTINESATPAGLTVMSKMSREPWSEGSPELDQSAVTWQSAQRPWDLQALVDTGDKYTGNVYSDIHVCWGINIAGYILNKS